MGRCGGAGGIGERIAVDIGGGGRLPEKAVSSAVANDPLEATGASFTGVTVMVRSTVAVPSETA